MNESTVPAPRADSVVPVAMEAVRDEIEGGHLGLRDLGDVPASVEFEN
jgi:hypothetical protein